MTTRHLTLLATLVLTLLKPTLTQNTTNCIEGCLSWDLFARSCNTFFHSDESPPACHCHSDLGTPWSRYGNLLSCVSCDEDGLSENSLEWYQQWAVVCNVFSAKGNAAALTVYSYGGVETVNAVFSSSILPALREEGTDGGPVGAFALDVNGTAVTVGGGATTTGDAGGGAATVAPAASGSLPASTTAAGGATLAADAASGEGEEESEEDDEDSNASEDDSESGAGMAAQPSLYTTFFTGTGALALLGIVVMA
ncbi:hypothetical protein MBLNU230_g8222t1 [Neophaeotheca triangularis]